MAKILLIEDNQFLRDVYIDILEKAGYSVETASDGEEGLTKILQGGWDLILLDMLLPKKTGFEIMEFLQTHNPQKPNKVIVFLTNVDTEEEMRQMKNFGNDFLIKSQFAPDEFLGKVRGYLV